MGLRWWGFLLGVAHADHSHDGPSSTPPTSAMATSRGGAPPDVLLPAVRVEKCLVEFYEEVLPEVQLRRFCQLRERFKLCFHPQHNLSFCLNQHTC